MLAANSSLRLACYLSNVHTWAISFLRHLANMSSMVPFCASTDSGFVPNLGPASEATPFSFSLNQTSFISVTCFDVENRTFPTYSTCRSVESSAIADTRRLHPHPQRGYHCLVILTFFFAHWRRLDKIWDVIKNKLAGRNNWKKIQASKFVSKRIFRISYFLSGSFWGGAWLVPISCLAGRAGPTTL